jgi:glycosyltransferase involved in cell wall biosynthesis
VYAIIPTTGLPELKQAIESVLNQTYEDTTCYVVVDGRELWKYLNSSGDGSKVKYASLPINVGAKGF